MAKYVYPAIFEKENEGYSISFPDIVGCYTSADNLKEGLDMAKDALCLKLYDMEENNEIIPIPSNIQKYNNKENSFVTLISCDTFEYRKFYENKAIKKTLTIPMWLNNIAEANKINFSETLQNAVMRELGLATETYNPPVTKLMHDLKQAMYK